MERHLTVLSINGAIAELGLRNGPLNLVTAELLRQLNDSLVEIAANAGLRCLIVHGGDARAFCAGSDMKEFAGLRTAASERKILFEDRVLRRLAELPMPTIAAIDGPAMGGGLELALACDLRVCRHDATLALPESRIGGLAGNGSVRLARLVGPSRAKELLFTGETIGADQALAWGIVNRIAKHESALTLAREVAETISARGPLSNRLAKKLVDATFDMPLQAGLSLSTSAQEEIFRSDDLHEGVSAFFEKRVPRFRGK